MKKDFLLEAFNNSSLTSKEILPTQSMVLVIGGKKLTSRIHCSDGDSTETYTDYDDGSGGTRSDSTC